MGFLSVGGGDFDFTCALKEEGLKQVSCFYFSKQFGFAGYEIDTKAGKALFFDKKLV